MYVKNSDRITSELIRVNIISTDMPEEFPLTSDDITNLPDGLSFVPYSTFYVASTSKTYILGTDFAWYEYTEGGGGSIINPASDSEIQSVINGLSF